MKLGILKLSHLGDIIHTLPLAYVIKKERPDFEIHWIIEKNYLKTFENINFVDKFLPFCFKGKEILNSFKRLRAQNLDFLIDAQGLYKTVLISFFSNSCKRVGFGLKGLKEKNLFFLYHKKISPQGTHIIDKNLSFASYLGIDHFYFNDYNLKDLSEDPEGRVSDFLKKTNFEKFGIFHPFSSSKDKDFPLKPIKEICHFLKTKNTALVITYGPGQEKRAEEASTFLDTIKAPTFSIKEMAYLIEKSIFFIGPDTGFYHLADAFRKPLVGFFTWHSPERNGNYFSKGLNFYKEEIQKENILNFLEENCPSF
ncbi:MAG: glycosyltransferase family 9 protein [Thermoanaerobaculia bacterium]